MRGYSRSFWLKHANAKSVGATSSFAIAPWTLLGHPLGSHKESLDAHLKFCRFVSLRQEGIIPRMTVAGQTREIAMQPVAKQKDASIGKAFYA